MSALYLLLIIPIIGIYFIFTLDCFKHEAFIGGYTNTNTNVDTNVPTKGDEENFRKKIAFITTIINLIVSLVIYMLFDFSNNQFQFIQENLDLTFYDIYLGVDGVSIYFVLLTTIIMPIALISN